MTDSTVSTLPGHIVFDLDAEERENEKPPFVALVKGREISMKDPADMDWRDLLLLENPTEFLRLALSTEDKQYLLGLALPGWRFNKLMEAYYQHYDLEGQLAQARRKQQLGG